MSRIGNRILTIPKDTIVKLENGTNSLESFNPVIGNIVIATDNSLTVTGVKGSLKKLLPNIIKINIDNEKKTISTIRPDDNKKNKQLHGTINSLINSMLIGVSTGFMKELEINGVGYRAAVQGNILNLILGYSHPIKFEIPQGISIVAPKPTVLQISGIDKQLVGEVAAKIRQFRKPEPYKGKGIKYKNEHIRRKEGKAAGKGK